MFASLIILNVSNPRKLTCYCPLAPEIGCCPRDYENIARKRGSWKIPTYITPRAEVSVLIKSVKVQVELSSGSGEWNGLFGCGSRASTYWPCFVSNGVLPPVMIYYGNTEEQRKFRSFDGSWCTV